MELYCRVIVYGEIVLVLTVGDLSVSFGLRFLRSILTTAILCDVV